MKNHEFNKYKMAVVVLAVTIALLEIPGALNLPSTPYAGYLTDCNNTVVNRVFAESPAQRAGLRVGDYILRIGGISTKDSRALARQIRAKIGETRTFIVEREGENISIDLTFSKSPTRQLFLLFGSAVIGFSFLIFGIWPYLRFQTKTTTLLALVGLCLALSSINRMYFASYTIRTIYVSIINVIAAFGFAFLLHYMLVFPKPKAIIRKKYIEKVLYGPATLIALFLLYRIIIQPDATSSLHILPVILVRMFLAGYFGLSIVAMIYSYIKATPQERKEHGLTIMLLGIVIGFLPIIIYTIIRILSPNLVIPGAQFVIFTIVFIPISLAIATLKQENGSLVR